MRPWRYDRVLKIPEGEIGDVRVQHIPIEPGEALPTCNARTQAFAGHAWPPFVAGPKGATFHRLAYTGGTWTTDLPIEQMQQWSQTRRFHGDILLGGLGLGMLPTLLRRRGDVGRIVVVEKDPRVILLVGTYLTAPFEIVHDDVYAHLRQLPKGRMQYDFAYYDIWQGDTIETFFKHVLPLRRLSEGVVRHVACWNEDVMRKQLLVHGRRAIAHVQREPESLDDYRTRRGRRQRDNWLVPFFRDTYRGPRDYTRDLCRLIRELA